MVQARWAAECMRRCARRRRRASSTWPTWFERLGGAGRLCEDCRAAAIDDLLKAEQPLAGGLRTGSADGPVSKKLESARNQLAVEAAAYDNRCAAAAKVKSARQYALVREAENLRASSFAERQRRGAFFGDGFKAPGASDEREQ